MRRILKFIPLFLLLFGIMIIVPVQANGPLKFMVLEKVDLFLDGSITPIMVNLTEPFDHVMRFVWNLIWEDNAVEFDVFGTLAVPLTNGTRIFYNNTVQLEAVRAIEDFGTASYDVRIDKDDRNPKSNHLYSRLSFTNFIDTVGGLNVHEFDLQFEIRDNITDACSNFFVLVEGYRVVVPHVAAKQFPINPFDYFNRWALWALTQPLVWLMILISFAIIMFIFRNLMR